MKRHVVVIACLVLTLTGCRPSSGPGGGGAVPARRGTINGAGATFPYPIYSRWFSEYSREHPDVRINYQSIGSGGGVRQVSEGTIDFGATDGPMSDAQIAAARIKTVHIPTVLGAVVPVYNLSGIDRLNLSPGAIAGIYLGKITRWNDAAITADNPGVTLPATTILPVYRSDGSGTTFIFTDFLSKTDPEFAARVGKAPSVRWPAGIGQKGNEGVAGMVRKAPNAFGYVELVFAAQNHMPFAAVRNAAGDFIRASPESVTAAAAATAASVPADFRTSITNAPGEGSYPISSFTWLLLPSPPVDPVKGRALASFIGWMLDRGEGEAAAMHYAPLPPEIAAAVRRRIASLR